MAREIIPGKTRYLGVTHGDLSYLLILDTLMLVAGADINRYIGNKLALMQQLVDSGSKYSEEDQVIELMRGDNCWRCESVHDVPLRCRLERALAEVAWKQLRRCAREADAPAKEH